MDQNHDTAAAEWTQVFYALNCFKIESFYVAWAIVDNASRRNRSIVKYEEKLRFLAIVL